MTLLTPTARLSLLSLPGSEALRSFPATRLIAATQVEMTLLVSFGNMWRESSHREEMEEQKHEDCPEMKEKSLRASE